MSFIGIPGNIGNTINQIRAIATAAVDVVGIYDAQLNQLFVNARAIKAVIKPDSKSFDHPLEDSTTIVDDRVLLPIEIELSLIIRPGEVENTYQQISQIFSNGQLVKVQTKTAIYDNQLIIAMPHEEDPSMFDTVVIALKLRQTQFAVTSLTTIAPRNPSQGNTVNRGNLQPQSAPPSDSALIRLGRAFRRFL